MFFKQLQQFRQTIYECLRTAKDTTSELIDAVLTSAQYFLIRQPVLKSSIWLAVSGQVSIGFCIKAKLIEAN